MSISKRLCPISVLAATALALGGCGQPPDQPPAEQAAGALLMSSLQRDTAPDVAPGDLAAQVGGNNAFAFDMLHGLRGEQQGNLFFSPFSISMALAMTYAGARTETEAQMAAALRYLLPQQALHASFNLLDLELASRGQGAQGSDGEPFRLRIANASWGREGHPFLPEYLDTLALNYGAGLRLLDFGRDPEAARLVINGWVEEQTEERIKDLLPPFSIDPSTFLVLTNAVYFNAAWAHKFDEAATIDAPFTLRDGTVVQVPTMRQGAGFRHAAGQGFTAVELPYDGEELSMLLLLPDAGELEALEQALSAELLDEVVAALAPADVLISLPRWTFETPSISVGDLLSELGMPIAFSSDADFSGMDGQRFLFISKVLHKAFVKVNEAGTEAAAATAVVMAGSAPPEYIEVDFDRPFFYLIRDHATGTVLFMGCVEDPRG